MNTKALRQKILDLAIRGKLVPQDPNDEPASVLLERIRAEKQKMVKEGKLKAKDIKTDSVIYKGEDNLHYEKFADGTVKCIEDELPFDIPDSWAWTRLNSIGEIITGTTPSKNNAEFYGGTFPFFKPTDLDQGKNICNANEYLTESGKKASRIVPAFSTLVCCIGSIGKSGLLTVDGTTNQQINTIVPFAQVNQLFVYYSVCTDLFQNQLKNKASATTVAIVNKNEMSSIIFALPPFNQQVAIVNILEQAFDLLQEIEKDKDDIIHNVVSAKSRILDLAIRGKLVPQDPNDEPASVLLERIKAEKEELIKQGKIKREKTESAIIKGEDNSYYEKLPEGWVLVNFRTICELLSGRDLQKSEYSDTEVGIPYIIGASNFDNGNIIIERWTNNPQVISFKNDILLTCKGTVGELAFNTCGDVHIARQVMAIRNKTTILPEYLMLLMKYSINNVKQKAKGLIPGISREDITNLYFLIPPLKEQCRIVEAIEKYFAYLDNIAQSLA